MDRKLNNKKYWCILAKNTSSNLKNGKLRIRTRKKWKKKLKVNKKINSKYNIEYILHNFMHFKWLYVYLSNVVII